MTILSPEAALLGCALHDPRILDDVTVEPGDFAHPQGGELWSVMHRLRAKGAPVSPTAVLAEAAGSVVRIDPSWVAELVTEAPPAVEGEHHAGLVIEAAIKRRVGQAGRRAIQLAESDTPAADAVEIARAEIDACTRTITQAAFVRDSVDDVLDSLTRAPDYHPTPWADMNHLLGGWRPGKLYIVGARPSVGKSLLMLNAATDLARTGLVAVNSLEMSEAELIKRVFAAVGRVNLGRILNNRLTDDDWARIAAARPIVDSLGLSIDENPSARPVDIRSHARTLHRQGNLKAVFVDYVQLMSAPTGDKRPRQEVVSEFSRSLKVLAKELNVPVIALAQLNRDAAGKRPVMSELKESGALEQDADAVILLHVEESDPSVLYVDVPKHRDGAPGSFELVRLGHYAQLANYAGDAP
jgi:replicative DNA helicase